MSEPIFKLANDATGIHIRQLDKFVKLAVLVPVERCEHGNIDEHDVRNIVSNEFEYLCPGAGIGGDDVPK